MIHHLIKITSTTNIIWKLNRYWCAGESVGLAAFYVDDMIQVKKPVTLNYWRQYRRWTDIDANVCLKYELFAVFKAAAFLNLFVWVHDRHQQNISIEYLCKGLSFEEVHRGALCCTNKLIYVSRPIPPSMSTVKFLVIYVNQSALCCESCAQSEWIYGFFFPLSPPNNHWPPLSHVGCIFQVKHFTFIWRVLWTKREFFLCFFFNPPHQERFRVQCLA